jgi:hypothetical protein
MMTGGWVGEEGAGRSGKSRSGDGLMGQETLKSARDICTVRAATIRTQPSRCLRGELLSCEGRSEASEHASGGGEGARHNQSDLCQSMRNRPLLGCSGACVVYRRKCVWGVMKRAL